MFLVLVHREDFAGIGDGAGDRSSGDHERAHEQRAAGGRALAALEVAIRGARAELIADELVGVHREAHRATRSAPLEASLAEHLIESELLALQRDFARTPPGAVLDGRDIGTVICPEADVKIYVTATPEVRARRRMLEMVSQGKPADEAAILADIRRRDERDKGRAVAPLVPAADAHILDTSDLAIEAVVDKAIGIIETARPAGR